MLKIFIHGYNSSEQSEIRALLLQLVIDRHGWVVEENTSPASQYRLRFEIALFDIMEVYGALQTTGIQFTPLAHRALTEMCLCQKHLSDSHEVQTVTVDLRVTTQEEERVHFQRFVRPHYV